MGLKKISKIPELKNPFWEKSNARRREKKKKKRR